MKITVLGSWREKDAAKWSLKGQDKFAAACRQLGEAIVRQGHSLIAASDDEDTADFHAVEGALAALDTSPVAGQPIVLFGDRTKFGKWQTESKRKWITTDDSPEPAWEYAKVFQVRLSDCVVTVGGAEGTFQAGFTAAVAGRLVVPVGAFGGASERLRYLFSRTYSKWVRLPPVGLLGQLKLGWHPDQVNGIAGLIGIARRTPRLAIIHGRSPDRGALADLLRDEKLSEPVIMREEFLAGATLAEKWERLANEIDGAIALVTPDDVGGLADAAGAVSSAKPRARENVWVEVGWVWGRLGRKRLLLVRQGNPEVPSDLHGIDLAEYETCPKEAAKTIRAFVESIREQL